MSNAEGESTFLKMEGAENFTKDCDPQGQRSRLFQDQIIFKGCTHILRIGKEQS